MGLGGFLGVGSCDCLVALGGLFVVGVYCAYGLLLFWLVWLGLGRFPGF